MATVSMIGGYRRMQPRVAEAIAQRKTRVLDFDLRAYFDANAAIMWGALLVIITPLLSRRPA
jgi:hypothetical protein